MQVRTARASEQGSSDAPAHSRGSGKQGSTGYGLQEEAEAFRSWVVEQQGDSEVRVYNGLP